MKRYSKSSSSYLWLGAYDASGEEIMALKVILNGS
jgi:hypothetical protein